MSDKENIEGQDKDTIKCPLAFHATKSKAGQDFIWRAPCMKEECAWWIPSAIIADMGQCKVVTL